jgi:hypothetical protein
MSDAAIFLILCHDDAAAFFEENAAVKSSVNFQ